MTKNPLASLMAGIAILLVGLAVSFLYWPVRGPDVSLINGNSVGGPYKLVDESGRTVTDETFLGSWKLIFFGFTYCPDICPTTLADVSRVLTLMDDKATQLQPLFVTVDPERDTPEVLAEYTAFFDDRILGLGGSPEQVRTMTERYNVYVERVSLGDNYMLDHTTFLYLMGPDGEFVERFNQQDSSDRMATRIVALMDGR